MYFTGIRSINDLLKVAMKEEITDEMIDFFDKRTKKHIDLVKKYCKKIHEYNSEKFNGIIERGEEHDKSKYEKPELDPYIYITWDYHCKDTGKEFNISDEIKNKMNEATEHHVKANPHHPEYHLKSKDVSTINREDRDKIPDKIIDATGMDALDIGEMIADWCAMSEEKGNSPHEWARKNVGKRWRFTNNQEKMIYDLLDNIWGKES